MPKFTSDPQFQRNIQRLALIGTTGFSAPLAPATFPILIRGTGFSPSAVAGAASLSRFDKPFYILSVTGHISGVIQANHAVLAGALGGCVALSGETDRINFYSGNRILQDWVWQPTDSNPTTRFDFQTTVGETFEPPFLPYGDAGDYITTYASNCISTVTSFANFYWVVRFIYLDQIPAEYLSHLTSK